MRTLCFGEILMRLSPTGRDRLIDARRFDGWVGGAEANVACALATLGHDAGMASILPDSPLGHAALGELRRSGVDVATVQLAPGRMGLYFLESGSGGRSARILYDRAGSAFLGAASAYHPDWAMLFEGCDLLHVSGISLALSASVEATTLALMHEARRRGVMISFDCNFRPSLWDERGVDPRPIVGRAIELADILFGNHRDVALLLDWKSETDGEERRRAAALAAFGAFPRLRMIASTARHVVDDRTHRIAGRIDYRGAAYATGQRTIGGIVDRIGTGDAFVAGILDGHLHARPPEESLSRSMALLELKHGVAGDLSRFTHAEVEQIMAGRADVRR